MILLKTFSQSWLLFSFILFLILVRIWFKNKRKVYRGRVGEKRVSSKLSRLPFKDYFVINDLMLKNGVYSIQIDHIVISPYGIFIIETKSHKGWIYGNSNTDNWIQNIYGNKYNIYNPLFQNEKHIKFLKRRYSLLKIKEAYIHSLVVFTNASKLKVNNDSDNVIMVEDLLDYIKSYNSRVINKEDCVKIANILENDKITERSVKKQHIKNVKKAKRINSRKVNHGICPCCNGNLVKRKGKYGYFLGCSNFPKCKYTHPA